MSNQVSLKDFRKWLIKSCKKNLEMQKKNITVTTHALGVLSSYY